MSMPIDQMLNFVPAFTLAFFRLAGLMLMSPLFGSARIPKRVKLLFVSVATMACVAAIPAHVDFPPTVLETAVAVGGELMFGLAMGTIVSFVFIAVQWAGEMIGQQIGFNLAEVFDPQYGQAGSLVGDIYFMLTLMVFLTVNGHHVMLKAVHESFATVPLLTLGVDGPLFDAFVAMFKAATVLAMRLAAPMFLTMLVVDVAMGTIGRAMPQFNIMSAGVPIRSLVGMVVLIGTLGLTGDAIGGALGDNLRFVFDYFGKGNAHG